MITSEQRKKLEAALEGLTLEDLPHDLRTRLRSVLGEALARLQSEVATWKGEDPDYALALHHEMGRENKKLRSLADNLLYTLKYFTNDETHAPVDEIMLQDTITRAEKLLGKKDE